MADERPLTIAHVDAERGFSGGEVQVFLLMEGLRERGHRNVLLCPPGARAEEEARARGIETRCVRMRGDVDLGAVIGLRRELDHSGANLVHLHTGRATWLGGLAAKWAGLRSVTTRRMDRKVKRNWRTQLIYRRLVDRAVAISPAVSRRLLDAGVPAERVTTIPSVVDPRSVKTEADREETRAALGVEPEAFVLLTLVSLVPRKGIDVLLRALPAMRAARADRAVLLVGGDGPEREPLERLAAELGLSARVTFLGRRADKAELLAACDAFVLPSRQEGLGVAALEAMAAGRVVVASRVGGLGETVVHEGTGLLVPPDEPEALARALDRLLEEPGLRERLGAAGPARVEDGHLPEQMVAAYEKLYREILKSR